MRLSSLGLSPTQSSFFESARSAHPDLIAGRVFRQSRGWWQVATEAGPLQCRLAGALSRASSCLELPGVGDWVAVSARDRIGLVRAVLPRTSALVRGGSEDSPRPQLLAANVDWVLVVESLDRPASPQRVQRLVALGFDSGAVPIVVLNKADTVPDPGGAVAEARAWSGTDEVIAVSARRGELGALRRFFADQQTAVLIGLSGVGKSSLVNALLESAARDVGEVRDWDRKGKHVSTDRELLAVPGGGWIIDGPGLREAALWGEEGLARAFEDLELLAERCRFADCAHEQEPGCAVRSAVEPERLEAYFKLRREQQRRADPRERKRLDRARTLAGRELFRRKQ